MSVISTRHTVVPFTAGKSQPLSGQRLVKVTYKSSTDKKTGIVTPAEYPSVCVSVPPIADTDITENIEKLAPYFRDYLAEVQGKVVKSLYESAGGNLSSVSDEEIGIPAIVGYLEAESTGSRLTKEFLSAWFDENVKDVLTVTFAEMLGFQDMSENQMAQINPMVKDYKDMISALSGGATFYSPDQAKELRKALRIAAVDDETNKKLSARIEKMIEPVKMAKLALLPD